MSSGTSRTSSCRRVLVAFLALLWTGCGVSANYFSSHGPRYLGAHAAVPPEQDGVLKVVTFNIAHGRRIDDALAILRDYPHLRDSDVLALQEMDPKGVERMARELRLNYVYYPASRGPGDDRDMGNAILSPWPIEMSWKVPLPWLTRVIHRSRAATGARLRVEGRAIVAYSIHFGSPWGMGGGGRRDQARAVLRHAEQFREPVIVAGDANSWGVGREFEAAGFSWVTRGIGRTVGPFSFDHIYARGLDAVGESAAGVEREARKASDHRPVWALLTWSSPPSP